MQNNVKKICDGKVVVYLARSETSKSINNKLISKGFRFICFGKKSVLLEIGSPKIISMTRYRDNKYSLI